jgi:hypothetical protein
MENIIGGLNFDASISAQDYKAVRDLQEQELLKRFLLSMGSPPGTTPTSGIVDITNPNAISASETTRPLIVTISGLNPLQVQVNSGTVVTPTGAVVAVAANLSLSLARTQLNDVNVVFVESSLVGGGTQSLNDYQDYLYAQDVANPDNLEVALLTDWNNVSLFPPSRKANIVVLAIVTVVATSNSGVAISIDLTNTTYSYNRPWFTVQDIQHRSYVGSGTVTDSNPHGTALNDLSTSGNVSLFQGLVDTGIVTSRDLAISKMPGAVYCTEQVPVSRIQTDSTGTVTANSIYGGVDAQYIQLLAFPSRLGSVYQTGNVANSISAEVIEGTNILVFGPEESLTNPMVVEYTEAQALLPPVTAPSNVLVFGTPASGELIIAGGQNFATVANPTVNMEGTGPFPRLYTVYMLGTGDLVVYPQTILGATFVSALGTSLTPPTNPMIDNARIRIGLTKPTAVSGMDLQITLYGNDVNGNQLTEVIEFSTASGYVDETVPSTNYDSPNQQIVSQNIFSVLNNIQVTSTTNLGPLATIQIWAELEPSTAPDLNDMAKVAVLSWNGMGISNVQDARVVSRGFSRAGSPLRATGESLLDSGKMLSALQTAPLLNKISLQMFSESFDDLKYFDSVRGFYQYVKPTGVIAVSNYSYLATGDTIQITPTAQLTVVAGTPAPGQGQFQVGSSSSATMANIVAAINDTTWTPGATASLGTGFNVNLILNSLQGSAGNAFQISAVLANSLALSITGYQYGFDPTGECYMDRAVTGLKSVNVPASNNLIAENYYYRTKYRSRAISLPASQTSQTGFAIEIHGEDKYYPSSVRIRASYVATPGQWTGWQVCSAFSPGLKGLYKATFGEPVFKIQVEYFGRAYGLSAYNLNQNS